MDPTTGEIREAEIFVAVLGASNLTYAEATWTQQLADWTAAHIQIEDVAEKGTAELRLKGAGKEMKRAG